MKHLSNGIPKMVHQIWLGSPTPSRWDGFRESWRNTHSDWEMKLWTEDNINVVVEQAICPELIAPSAGPVQARADLLRLEVLRQFGGVYADLDIFAFRRLEHLLPEATVVYSDLKPNMPNNCYLVSPKGHPFVEWTIQQMSRWRSAWTKSWTASDQCDLVGMNGFGVAIRAWVGPRWVHNGPVLDDSGSQIGVLWGLGLAHLSHLVFQSIWRGEHRPPTAETFTAIIDEAKLQPQAYGIHVGAKDW